MERDKGQKRRSFSAEYKAEAVRLVKNSGKSIGVVALELGLVESALRRWVQQDEIKRGGGGEGALTSSEREELTRLRRENQRLRMERETFGCHAAASPAGQETLQAITVSAGLGAMAVRFLVTSRTR